MIIGTGTGLFGSIKSSQQEAKAAAMYDLSARQIEQQNYYIEQARRAEADAYARQSKIYEHNAAQLETEARINQVIGEINETIGLRDAAYIKKAGAQKALALRRQADRVEGAQYARSMKGNVIMEGTPMELLKETASLASEDIANVLESASLAEQDARFQAANARLAGMQGATSSFGAAANQRSAAAGALAGAQQTMAMLPYELSANNFKAWQMRSQAAQMEAQSGLSLLTGFSNTLSGFGSSFLHYGPKKWK